MIQTARQLKDKIRNQVKKTKMMLPPKIKEQYMCVALVKHGKLP